MPDNNIRIGAILDASAVSGGLDFLLDALAKARAGYAVTAAQVKLDLANWQAAEKALAKASDDTRAVLSANAKAAFENYSSSVAAAENYRATIQGLELQFSAFGFQIKNVNAALNVAQTSMSGAAASATNLGTAAAGAATAMQGLAAAATAGGAGGGIGGIGAAMAAAAATAGAATPPIQQVGAAASSASIPIFRIYALLFMVRRALDQLDKFRESEEQLRHFSDATGIAAQQIAQFQGMIDRAGGNADKFDQTLMKLSRSMQMAASGNQQLAAELAALGVTTKDPIEAFLKIADTVHNAENRMDAATTAARVLGKSSTEIVDLIGVLAEGSEKLREYYNQSEEVARSRANATDSAHELTIAEKDLKQALVEVAADALPGITEGLKIMATTVDMTLLPFKQLVDILVQLPGVLEGITEAANISNFLSLDPDKISEGFSKGADRATAAVNDMKAAIKKDLEDTTAFVNKMLFAAPETKPPAGTQHFNAPGDPKEFKKKETELRNADQEAFADLQASHKTTISEEIAFWEERLAKESGYADRVREIKRTLGHDYQRLDAEELTYLRGAVREQAEILREGTSEAENQAAEGGGKQGALTVLQNRAQEMFGNIRALASQGIFTPEDAARIQPFIDEYHRILKLLPHATVEAFDANKAAVKTGLEEQFKLWEDSGTRTLGQQKQFWATAVLDTFEGADQGAFALKKWEDASRKLADATRKASEEIAKLNLEAQKESDLQSIAIDRLNLRATQETRLLPTGNQQKIADLQAQKALDIRQGAAEEAPLKKEAEGATNVAAITGDPEMFKQAIALWDAYQRAVDKDQLKIAQDNVAIAHQMILPWQQAFGTLESGFEHAVGAMAAHGKGFGAEMTRTFQSIEQSAVSSFIRIGEQFLLNEFKKLATKQLIDHLLQAEDFENAAIVAATSKTAATESITAKAADAAASTWASVSAIPIVGPFLAPPAAAATYAGVLALAAFEQGGQTMGEGLAYLHTNETILNSPLTNSLTQMTQNGSFGNSTTENHYHTHNYGGVSVNAGSNASAGDIGSATYAALRKHARDMHTRL